MTIATPAGRLQDKIAVVTGAGAGIGAVTAELFVSEGAQVLAADVSGRQEAVAADLGEAARPFQVGLTQEDQIEAMFAYAASAFGRVDILVNVAGNPGGRRGEEITVEEYDSITSVHVKGTLFTNKHAARTFAGSGGGAIVNFSSAASFNIDPKISLAYSAPKAPATSPTTSSPAHYGPYGVRANAVAPGFTLSEKNRAIPDDVARELAS